MKTGVRTVDAGVSRAVAEELCPPGSGAIRTQRRRQCDRGGRRAAQLRQHPAHHTEAGQDPAQSGRPGGRRGGGAGHRGHRFGCAAPGRRPARLDRDLCTGQGQAALATFTQRDVAICTVAERRERIAGELTGHGGLLKIFSAGAAGRENGSLRRAERGPGRVRRGTGGPDLESVCYTSGTTGKPKARPAWRGYYAALPASPSTT